LRQVTIIGCGDLGEVVAQIWYSRGVPVNVVLQNMERATQLSEKDFNVTLCNLDKDNLAKIPVHKNRVYYFAPPVQNGHEDCRFERWLASLDFDNCPKKIVYISTTGVYGDCQGAWVDEQSLTNPQTDRAKRRLDAEHKLQQWARQHIVPVVVLRVAGIYGPDRLPIAAIQRKQPVVRKEEAPYSNRIHADDLAQVCVAAMLKPDAHGIYNVCDGQETTMAEYYQKVARLLGCDPLPEISWEQAQRVFSPVMLSYLSESRRVRNEKMLRELKVKLRYPTLQQGLEAMLHREEIQIPENES